MTLEYQREDTNQFVKLDYILAYFTLCSQKLHESVLSSKQVFCTLQNQCLLSSFLSVLEAQVVWCVKTSLLTSNLRFRFKWTNPRVLHAMIPGAVSSAPMTAVITASAVKAKPIEKSKA